MKKILIIVMLTMVCKNINAQTINDTLTHTDSVNVQLVDTIYANKSNYIGYPMSKLYIALPHFIEFSQPDNIGISRKYGTAHYQNFTLYLPGTMDDGIYGFVITLTSKVYVKVEEYFNAAFGLGKKNVSERNIYVKELLKDAIITGIEKNN